MLPSLRFPLSSRRGATSIEYALIASLVSVFIIGSVMALSNVMQTNYYSLIEAMARDVF